MVRNLFTVQYTSIEAAGIEAIIGKVMFDVSLSV